MKGNHLSKSGRVFSSLVSRKADDDDGAGGSLGTRAPLLPSLI